MRRAVHLAGRMRGWGSWGLGGGCGVEDGSLARRVDEVEHLHRRLALGSAACSTEHLHRVGTAQRPVYDHAAHARLVEAHLVLGAHDHDRWPRRAKRVGGVGATVEGSLGEPSAATHAAVVGLAVPRGVGPHGMGREGARECDDETERRIVGTLDRRGGRSEQPAQGGEVERAVLPASGHEHRLAVEAGSAGG